MLKAPPRFHFSLGLWALTVFTGEDPTVLAGLMDPHTETTNAESEMA